MEITREIEKSLIDEFDRREISILLGPRQVGKTFLLNKLELYAKSRGLRVKSFNLEIPSDILQFNKSEEEIFSFLTHDTDVIFIDEFHYLKNASKIFKAIYDSKRRIKIFATGSSSIEIHKHLRESLAGRRLTTRIYPFSYSEYVRTGIKNSYGKFLVFGGLPGLVHFKKDDEKIRLLNEIFETYIQKDVKSLIKEENIRAFNLLLYLLAEKQGSVISINSLAGEIGLTSKTIAGHLSILEHTYVIYPLYSYSRNLGNELKKSHKYYFYDTGIRNAIIKDFSPQDGRADSGVLHESFIFQQMQINLKPNMEIKFWRNKQGNEIDFVVLKNRKPFLVEVKTGPGKPEIPAAMKIFIKNYPETAGGIVFSSKKFDDLEIYNKKIRFMVHDDVTGFIEEFFNA